MREKLWFWQDNGFRALEARERSEGTMAKKAKANLEFLLVKAEVKGY